MNIRTIIFCYLIHFSCFAFVIVNVANATNANNIAPPLNPCTFLCNTDFEDDKFVNAGQFGFFHQDLVSCWSTTASDQQIEIWGSGFGGVPAFSGNQFAELNANMVSTLFQNFSASLGSSVEIKFAHRGRAGIDVMSVEIGPIGGPYQNLGNFTADNNAWVYNTVNYTFPKMGSIDYTLRFKSVSAAGGATVGNFLDAISINLQKPDISLILNQPDCPNETNGSIQLQVRGGSGPYKFNWQSPIQSFDSTVTGLSAGIYKVEITDFYGCTEVVSIPLLPNYKQDTTFISKKICDAYIWPTNGQHYTQSGLYSARLQNVYGCDSMIQLDLKILTSTLQKEQIQTCDVYFWPVTAQNYILSGLYSKTLINEFGCDSILTLDLEILPSFVKFESIQKCESYTWPVDGRTYTQSGIYNDTFSNIFGCDSVHRLGLNIINAQNVESFIKICDNYFWPVNGQTYTQSGTYSDTLLNILGCDSILTIKLTIIPTHHQIVTIQQCDSYTWIVNGQTYTKSGFYSDTLINGLGCDSILSLQLIINKTDQFSSDITTCDQYTWPINGQTYSQSGVYTKHIKSIFGCDSVFLLNLSIHKGSIDSETISACESYTWINGINYTQGGTYSLQNTNIEGCDSIHILYLNIHPSYMNVDTIRICESYTWPINGKTYSESGLFTRQLQTKFGCDSIDQLYLKIDPKYVIYDTIEAIEHYIWPVNNESYDESGIHEEIFETHEGCDSIRILFLNIKRKGAVFIPNVFSPNGDGINDHEIIFSSPEIKIIDQFSIYDRWGEKLFQKSHFPPNDPTYGWDGTARNQRMNPAVYVYVVLWTDLLGDKHIERGDVTLIK